MTDAPQGTPENEEPDEDNGSDQAEPHTDSDEFKDRMQSGGGMSLSRFEEISDAEQRGEPLELSDEECEEYEATKAKFAEVMASFRRNMAEPFQTINKQLGEIVKASFQPPKIKLPPSYSPPKLHLKNVIDPDRLLGKPYIPELPTYTTPAPLISEEQLDALAEASQEREERQDQIRDNTLNTAVAMKKMLDAMETEAERIKDHARTEKRRWWAIAIITALTLIAAAIPAIPLIVAWWPW